MKTIKYIGLFTILLIAISSCEDYLTKTIEFEDLGFEPAIVVNAKIVDSLDYLDVSISKNVDYGNNSNPRYEFIDGAVVTITIDGEVFTTTELTEAEEQQDVYNHILNFPAGFVLTGKKYELEATHPDYPTVTSSVEIAGAPIISGIVHEKEARTTTMFGYPITEDKTTFRIEDVAEEDNYYRIQVRQKDQFPISTTTDEPLALSIGDEFIMISDETFNGEDLQLIIYNINSNYYGSAELELEVRNISKGEFLFQQSYERYRSSQNFGFFAEPTTLFSNIENGFGLFSAEEVQRFDLE